MRTARAKRFSKIHSNTAGAIARPIASLWRSGQGRAPLRIAKVRFAQTLQTGILDLERAHAQVCMGALPSAPMELDRSLSRLLDAGRAHAIAELAARHQAFGGSGAGLLDIAFEAAQSGAQMSLFAIPLVFSDPDQLIDWQRADSLCTHAVADAMCAHGLVESGQHAVMLPTLLSHGQICALGLQGVADLRTTLAQSLLAKSDPLWGLHALSQDEPIFVTNGQPRTLRWAVGLCRWDEKAAEPGWISPLGPQQDPDVLDFMEELSDTISVCLGSSVLAGAPANLVKHLRRGAINEAANGLLLAASGHLAQSSGSQGESSLCLKLRSFDAHVPGQPPALEGLTRIHVQLLSGTVCVGDFQFECRSCDASAETEDLIAVVCASVQISRVDSLQHGIGNAFSLFDSSAPSGLGRDANDDLADVHLLNFQSHWAAPSSQSILFH